jgi:AraC-like DNA-binding protein
MVFRYKGKVTVVENGMEHTLAASGISGLRKTSRLIHYTEDSGNIIVSLKETGVAAFLKAPAHEFFEQSVPLEHFINQATLLRTEELLSAAKNHRQRISIVEQLLLSILTNHKLDNLIATAIEKIQASHGLMRIKDLANTLCISPDAFEKRFRRVVGTSPKQFSSIVRLRTLIQSRSEKTTFTELAYEAGYFDQAHFTKEFKTFTGLTPSEFFKSNSFW